MDFLTIFFLLACFNLLRLVYGDLKEQLVDERVSHYMYGVVAVIFLAMNLILQWVILTIVLLLVLSFVKEKLRLEQRKVFGAGDLTIICWIIPGLLILNLWLTAAFVLFYCFGNIFMFLITKKQRLPGTIPMLTATALTWLINYYWITGTLP
jgi:hypothetical protein